MQIVLLKVFCWKRIVHKCKWLSFRDNEFHFDQNENAFKVNECQRMVLFIFWLFWMLTHMQMLNVPYAQMKVILVLMRVYWPQWNKFAHKWMSIFCKWRAKGVVIVNYCAVAGTRLRNSGVLTFCQSFGGKFWWKWIIRILRRLIEGHLRFLDLKKLKLLKKWRAHVRNFNFICQLNPGNLFRPSASLTITS